MSSAPSTRPAACDPPPPRAARRRVARGRPRPRQAIEPCRTGAPDRGTDGGLARTGGATPGPRGWSLRSDTRISLALEPFLAILGQLGLGSCLVQPGTRLGP